MVFSTVRARERLLLKPEAMRNEYGLGAGMTAEGKKASRPPEPAIVPTGSGRCGAFRPCGKASCTDSRSRTTLDLCQRD